MRFRRMSPRATGEGRQAFIGREGSFMTQQPPETPPPKPAEPSQPGQPTPIPPETTPPPPDIDVPAPGTGRRLRRLHLSLTSADSLRFPLIAESPRPRQSANIRDDSSLRAPLGPLLAFGGPFACCERFLETALTHVGGSAGFFAPFSFRTILSMLVSSSAEPETLTADGADNDGPQFAVSCASGVPIKTIRT